MTSTLPPLVQAFSGAIGSASANLLTYPLDLVTTRVQLDPPQNVTKQRGIPRALEILQQIIRRHGISALYRGLWTDTGATFLSNFLYFYFYSFLRSLSTRRFVALRPAGKSGGMPPHKPTMLEELLLGFIAGVASRAVSTPLNIITLRLQVEGATYNHNGDKEGYGVETSKNGGMVAAVKHIYNDSGLAGFWRGFETTMLLSLNPSITLACFQLFRRFLAFFRSSSGRNPILAIKEAADKGSPGAEADPSPIEAFFGAAISNSIAVTILYPILLAKTRLQASSTSSLQDVIIDAYNGQDAFSVMRRKLQADRNVKPGPRGLYQGLEVQILKGFLSQGVTFLVKGRIEQMIVNAYLRRKHRPA
ncbi:putative mitochondrial carrier [Lyophyllum shimeji]|uniref:Mitochondrial carrier n=1 Tax=Lyophyllum shimeji TaxID=47721 RepID=A0A9P3PKB3_LYOSH|nr:putative mitochondrial carrier [Lyophyllum shimeji]